MNWRRLPSLFALRAFEAAARMGGLSRAAAELNVTHAAIAQHVRVLEAELGAKLLRREGRGMVPTPEGAALAAALGTGFEAIARGWEAAMVGERGRPVLVAVTPSFAEAWLMPRLPRFWAEHPEVRVMIEPSEALTDMADGAADIAVRAGRGGWDVPSEILLPFAHVVVSAPGRMPDGAARDPETWRGRRWLFDPSRSEQILWSRAVGIEIDDACVEELPSNAMVLAGVRAGAGLSVQPEPLVAGDLERGALQAGHRCETAPDLGYHLILAPGPVRDGVRAFTDWLRSEAQAP